ncbi:MAG TPA: ADP-ribosylation factor-like protein [Candidatus Deferrimicrobium sp.]|nr:ADP-ribosylation factor-like protein [Candidatus Deferrimicrobium sp.]
MKISLVGLAGCGKTSIYATTFAAKSPFETKDFAPTVMYEVRRHPYLGLNVSIFDFGGQAQYRDSYIEKPEIFAETDVIILIVDLHDPSKFETAKEYFLKIMDVFEKSEKKPKVILFLHKYDTEAFDKIPLESNLKNAKELFQKALAKWNPQIQITSIYDHEKLTLILRDILVANYESLQAHVQNAEKQLAEINAKIIISDVSGNVIVHNVPGITSGLQLRGDLRDFIGACNTLRENFFMTDSALFHGESEKSEKHLELHVFKFILTVLIMRGKDIDVKSEENIKTLLKDMELFADLVVSAHSD